MNCPACGYYNPDGATACFHCSLALPLPAGDALCPTHPGVKATGACSRCGTFGCGQCLTQRGADWLCPSCLQRQATLPWDERDSLGLWRAWWRTSVQMISSPGQTLQEANPDGSVGSSALFAGLSTLAGVGPSIALQGVSMVGIMAAALLNSKSGGSLASGVGGMVGMVFALFLTVAFFFGSVFLNAGLDHLMLMLLGANPRAYSVSLRAQALSMGPYLVGLIPICGFYVFPIWSLVLRIIALMHLHKTTAGKATLAVLVPVTVFCGLIMAFYIAVIGLAAGIAR